MPQLPETVEALLNPKAYADKPQGIELAQTQMSFVFLTDKYVYKVKKPVNLGFLDYTTLDKRRFFCQREVELNRRLCPDTYLGVVPITQERDNITLDGQGKTIEYAVKMRRLPQQAMLDVLLAKNQVSPEMVSSVAKKLANFHQNAEQESRNCNEKTGYNSPFNLISYIDVVAVTCAKIEPEESYRFLEENSLGKFGNTFFLIVYKGWKVIIMFLLPPVDSFLGNIFFSKNLSSHIIG